MLLEWVRPTYDFALIYAKKLVADVPDEQMTAQPVPGRMMNHPAFLLGHLAWAKDNGVAMLGGTPRLAHLKDLHGMGATPRTERSAYASTAQLIEWLEAAHAALRVAVEGATPAQLAAPPAERMRARFPTLGTMLAGLMTGHFTNHLGQMSAWRRAMGLPSVF
jgi:hypothetical protein